MDRPKRRDDHGSVRRTSSSPLKKRSSSSTPRKTKSSITDSLDSFQSLYQGDPLVYQEQIKIEEELLSKRRDITIKKPPKHILKKFQPNITRSMLSEPEARIDSTINLDQEVSRYRNRQEHILKLLDDPKLHDPSNVVVKSLLPKDTDPRMMKLLVQHRLENAEENVRHEIATREEIQRQYDDIIQTGQQRFLDNPALREKFIEERLREVMSDHQPHLALVEGFPANANLYPSDVLFYKKFANELDLDEAVQRAVESYTPTDTKRVKQKPFTSLEDFDDLGADDFSRDPSLRDRLREMDKTNLAGLTPRQLHDQIDDLLKSMAKEMEYNLDDLGEVESPFPKDIVDSMKADSPPQRTIEPEKFNSGKLDRYVQVRKRQPPKDFVPVEALDYTLLEDTNGNIYRIDFSSALGYPRHAVVPNIDPKDDEYYETIDLHKVIDPKAVQETLERSKRDYVNYMNMKKEYKEFFGDDVFDRAREAERERLEQLEYTMEITNEFGDPISIPLPPPRSLMKQETPPPGISKEEFQQLKRNLKDVDTMNSFHDVTDPDYVEFFPDYDKDLEYFDFQAYYDEKKRRGLIKERTDEELDRMVDEILASVMEKFGTLVQTPSQAQSMILKGETPIVPTWKKQFGESGLITPTFNDPLSPDVSLKMVKNDVDSLVFTGQDDPATAIDHADKEISNRKSRRSTKVTHSMPSQVYFSDPTVDHVAPTTAHFHSHTHRYRPVVTTEKPDNIKQSLSDHDLKLLFTRIHKSTLDQHKALHDGVNCICHYVDKTTGEVKKVMHVTLPYEDVVEPLINPATGEINDAGIKDISLQLRGMASETFLRDKTGLPPGELHKNLDQSKGPIPGVLPAWHNYYAGQHIALLYDPQTNSMKYGVPRFKVNSAADYEIGSDSTYVQSQQQQVLSFIRSSRIPPTTPDDIVNPNHRIHKLSYLNMTGPGFYDYHDPHLFNDPHIVTEFSTFIPEHYKVEGQTIPFELLDSLKREFVADHNKFTCLTYSRIKQEQKKDPSYVPKYDTIHGTFRFEDINGNNRINAAKLQELQSKVPDIVIPRQLKAIVSPPDTLQEDIRAVFGKDMPILPSDGSNSSSKRTLNPSRRPDFGDLRPNPLNPDGTIRPYDESDFLAEFHPHRYLLSPGSAPDRETEIQALQQLQQFRKHILEFQEKLNGKKFHSSQSYEERFERVFGFPPTIDVDDTEHISKVMDLLEELRVGGQAALDKYLYEFALRRTPHSIDYNITVLNDLISRTDEEIDKYNKPLVVEIRAGEYDPFAKNGQGDIASTHTKYFLMNDDLEERFYHTVGYNPNDPKRAPPMNYSTVINPKAMLEQLSAKKATRASYFATVADLFKRPDPDSDSAMGDSDAKRARPSTTANKAPTTTGQTIKLFDILTSMEAIDEKDVPQKAYTREEYESGYAFLDYLHSTKKLQDTDMDLQRIPLVPLKVLGQHYKQNRQAEAHQQSLYQLLYDLHRENPYSDAFEAAWAENREPTLDELLAAKTPISLYDQIGPRGRLTPEQEHAIDRYYDRLLSHPTFIHQIEQVRQQRRALAVLTDDISYGMATSEDLEEFHQRHPLLELYEGRTDEEIDDSLVYAHLRKQVYNEYPDLRPHDRLKLVNKLFHDRRQSGDVTLNHIRAAKNEFFTAIDIESTKPTPTSQSTGQRQVMPLIPPNASQLSPEDIAAWRKEAEFQNSRPSTAQLAEDSIFQKVRNRDAIDHDKRQYMRRLEYQQSLKVIDRMQDVFHRHNIDVTIPHPTSPFDDHLSILNHPYHIEQMEKRYPGLENEIRTAPPSLSHQQLPQSTFSSLTSMFSSDQRM